MSEGIPTYVGKKKKKKKVLQELYLHVGLEIWAQYWNSYVQVMGKLYVQEFICSEYTVELQCCQLMFSE